MSGDELPPLPPSSRARRVHERATRRASRAVLSPSDIAGIIVLGVIGIAIAGVLGVVLAGNLFRRDPPRTAAVASPSAPVVVSSRPPSVRPTVSAASTTAPWTGAIVAAPISGARASCGQHDLRTTTGRVVDFQAPAAIDGRARTAWRCAGDGVGQSLRIKLVAPSRVAAIGLVPGFAARDPITGKDGFTTDRRVLVVRWSLGGRVVEQRVDPAKERLQLLRIPVTLAGSVTMTILATQPAEEDDFAVSDIGVYAARP